MTAKHGFMRMMAAAVLLAVLFVCGLALADGGDYLTVTAGGSAISDGEVTGAWYYRINIRTNQAFEMGWSSDPEATEPKQSYLSDLERMDSDANNSYYIFSTPPSDAQGDEACDAMFYRMPGESAWHRLVFRYDLTKTEELSENDSVRLPADQAEPALLKDCDLSWNAVSGADAYILEWGREDNIRAMTVTGNQHTLPGQSFVNQVGNYVCRIHALKDGKKLISAASAESRFAIPPEIMVAPESGYAKENGDGSVTVKLNQWIDFDVYAPGAYYVQPFELETAEQEPGGDTQFDGCWTDDHGRTRFTWSRGIGEENFDRIVMVDARYAVGEGEDAVEQKVVSRPITIHVVCDSKIEEDITWSVPADVNTAESGVWQVARDGRLFVDVNNYVLDANGQPTDQRLDVNYFNVYIDGDNDRLADSHWVEASDGATTRVPLTVPRCTAGQDYQVSVCAVRFGAPHKDAAQKITIHVTEASTDSPVLVSMGDSFLTGEPLRVFAYYANPDELEAIGMQIRIVDRDNPDRCYFDQLGGIDDFWDEDATIWVPGTYTVEAHIMQYGQEMRTYANLKTFTVEAPEGVTAPLQVTPVAMAPAGQDLTLNLTVEPEEGQTVMPDWAEYTLWRTDWDYAFITEGRSDIENGAGSFTVPGDCLEAGGQYEIRLFSMKVGASCHQWTFRFLVINPDAEENLHLTVNGSSEAEQTYLSCTNLHVKVSYDSRPTAVRVRNGDRWEYWWGDDSFERDWSFGEGDQLFLAEATWDERDFDQGDFDWDQDVNWTSRSNLMMVHIDNPYGEMREPDVTLGSDQLAWGDDLVINIADAGPMGSRAGVEDAEVIPGGWFFLNLEVERTNDGGSWWERLDMDDDFGLGSGENRISTCFLEGGCRYRMEIGADAVGYRGISVQREFTLGEEPEHSEPVSVFTVNGIGDSEISAQTGEKLRLFAYRTGAEWYRVDITLADDDGWWNSVNDRGNGALIETWPADRAGTYTLTAYACGNSQDTGDVWEELIGKVTVNSTAPKGELGEPVVTVPESVRANEEIRIAFQLDSRVEQYSYWIAPEGEDWNNVYNDYMNAGNIARAQGDAQAETYEFVIPAWALAGGRSYHVHLDTQAVGYEQGHADRTIFVEEVQPEIQVDPVVSNAQALNIGVPVIEDANEYLLEIHYVPHENLEESYLYRKTLHSFDAENGMVTFTVPAGTLHNGMTHWLDCHVRGSGFECYNAKAILVTDAQMDSNITLQVSGTEVKINDSFTVNVSAPGARAILIRCGDRSWGFTGESAEGTFSEGQPYPETLYARACYDENAVLPGDNDWNFDWESLSWGAPSEAVVMNFYAIGQVEPAGFMMPDTVERGDLLAITGIYPGEGGLEAHANINLGTPDNEGEWLYGYGWHGWDPPTGTIYLSTSMLEPGQYWVAVDNSGIGLTGNRSWRQFTVTERSEQPADGILITTFDRVQVGVNLPISVYAPGAVQVGLAIDIAEKDKNNPDCYESMNGEIIYNMDRWRFDTVGEHTITAFARMTENGTMILQEKKVVACDPLRIDLTDLPGYFTAGQEDTRVTIRKPENAQYLRVQIGAAVSDDWTRLYDTDGNAYEESITALIPSQFMQEGNRIDVNVQAGGEGFLECYEGIQIPVTIAATGSGATLKLVNDLEQQAEIDTDNILVNQDIVFLVCPAEGKTIDGVRFYDGYGWWENGEAITRENHGDWFLDEDEGVNQGSVFFWKNYNDEGNHAFTVFAEVLVDGAWTRTNEIRFTVTSNGTVGAYDFTDHSTITVPRGTVVTVRFEEAEDATHYWADAFSTEDGRSWNPQTRNDEGTTVRISTSYLEPGTYNLLGRAGGEPGVIWRESDSSIRLIITDDPPAMKAAAFTTPAGLTQIEEEAFAGIPAKSIELTSQVEFVDPRAFADSGVEQIIFRNGDTRVNGTAFEGCGELTVYAPAGGRVQAWANWFTLNFYPIQ